MSYNARTLIDKSKLCPPPPSHLTCNPCRIGWEKNKSTVDTYVFKMHPVVLVMLQWAVCLLVMHHMQLEELYSWHQQKIRFTRINSVKWHHLECLRERVILLDSRWNVMAHGDAREGKWKGNWRMEWVASTLHSTSEHGVLSITTADAHTSAATSRLNWRPRRFKCTRPFRRKTKSGFCACAITFQLTSTSHIEEWVGFGMGNQMSWYCIRKHRTEFRNLPIYNHDAGHLDEIWPILEIWSSRYHIHNFTVSANSSNIMSRT